MKRRENAKENAKGKRREEGLEHVKRIDEGLEHVRGREEGLENMKGREKKKDCKM